jgi:hypothetical protein
MKFYSSVFNYVSLASSLMAERGADPGVRTIVMASVQDEARQLKLQVFTQ